MPSLRLCICNGGHLWEQPSNVDQVSSMPTVKMFFSEMSFTYNLCFLQGNTLVGEHWKFTKPEQIIALMETANCRFRDIEHVRQTLKERRPGSIDIELSQEQFDRLRTRKQRVQRKR